MLGHQRKIKKLSTAIRHGLKMCRERGIKQAKSTLIEVNIKGEVCGACALGMALIGVYGTKEAGRISNGKGYLMLQKLFGNKMNKCLPKTLSSKLQKNYIDKNIAISPQAFVYRLNDHCSMRPDKIADKLEACNL